MRSFEPNARLSLAATGFTPDPILHRAARETFESTPAVVERTVEEQIADAFERGLSEGRASLPWQDAEALAGALEALAVAANRLHELRRTYLVGHREAVVDLALGLADRLIRTAVAEEPDRLADAVERALDALDAPARATVALSVEDLEALRAGLAPRLEALAADDTVEFEVGAGLKRGDIVVSAPPSTVDLRIHEVLSRLRDELTPLAECEGGCE